MSYRLWSYVYATVFLLLASVLAWGQPSQTSPEQTSPRGPTKESISQPSKEPSFYELVQQRDDLLAEVKTLSDKITNLHELDWSKVRLAEATRSDERKGQRDKIQNYEWNLGLPQGAAKNLDVPAEIKRREDELKAAKEKLKMLEAKINHSLDLEYMAQSFKTKVSFIFAAIVGSLIVGFFVLAGIDQEVSREIFRGELGIQFITLFSLVIAIILFGISGVLEGKELSALLGGISGYILGKSNAGTEPTRNRGDSQSRGQQQGSQQQDPQHEGSK